MANQREETRLVNILIIPDKFRPIYIRLRLSKPIQSRISRVDAKRQRSPSNHINQARILNNIRQKFEFPTTHEKKCEFNTN